jgi:NADH-quinone oxidoreductase subunit H
VTPAAQPSRRLPFALLALCAAFAVACGEPAATEILQLTDLGPRQLEVGDRLEITGQNLPLPGDIRRISVTLRGALARPGSEACRGPVEVTVSDPPADARVFDASSGQMRPRTYAESTEKIIRVQGARVELTVTEALLSSLTRCPGARAGEAETPHSTLTLGAIGTRGAAHGVTVRVDGIGGGRAIAGTLRGPVLDLFAPPARRLELETRARESAEGALNHLGITLAPVQPGESGLRVATVRPESPAARAGIVSNDVLVRLDGLSLLSLADFVPAPGARHTTLTTLRGEMLDEHVVSLEGYASGVPFDLVAAATLLTVLATLLGVLFLPKRGAALTPSSRTPSRRTSAGFVRWLTQQAGSVMRATPHEEGVVRAGPYLVLAALASSVAAVPFGPWIVSSGVDVTLLFASAFALRWIATVLSGETPGQGVRAALRSLPAQLPALVAIGCVVAMAGTVRLQGIAMSQGGHGWEWFVFRTPVSPVLLVLFALALLDARAEHEAHETTWRRGVGLVGEGLHLFAMSALGSALFLGAWQLPGVSFAEQDASVFLQMVGAAAFVAKTWACVLAALWFRWSLSGVSLAKVLARRWALLLGAMLCACGVTAAWVLWLPRLGSVVPEALSAGTCALSAVALLGLALRARRPVRAEPAWVYAPDPFR